MWGRAPESTSWWCCDSPRPPGAWGDGRGLRFSWDSEAQSHVETTWGDFPPSDAPTCVIGGSQGPITSCRTEGAHASHQALTSLARGHSPRSLKVTSLKVSWLRTPIKFTNYLIPRLVFEYLNGNCHVQQMKLIVIPTEPRASAVPPLHSRAWH